HFLDDLLDAVAQQQRLRRGLQAAAHAAEQRQDQRILGVLQRLTRRRLRDVQQLRRAGDAAGGGHGAGKFDISETHDDVHLSPRRWRVQHKWRLFGKPQPSFCNATTLSYASYRSFHWWV